MDLDALKAEDPGRLGEYVLHGRLGEGGQGVVYLAESPSQGRVAVKLLRPGVADDPSTLERFVREAETAQRVAPFCTAQIFGSGTHHGRPYLVTEYIEGPSLHEAVVAEGPKSGAALHRLAVGTITALTAIHQAGIVHRDLKPRNVLLAPDGPRVIDFGIAKALDVTSSLTGAPIGTPAYIAPEILAGHPASPAADLFSWGCTIAFAAQGGSPFDANSLPAIITRILNAVPDLGRMDEPLRQIVFDCLNKEPGRRPTAEQVLLRLLQRPALAPGVLAEAAAVARSEAASFPPGPAPAAPFGSPHSGPTWPGPGVQGATFPQGAPPMPWQPPPPAPYWAAPPPPRHGSRGPLLATAAVVAVILVAVGIGIVKLRGPASESDTSAPALNPSSAAAGQSRTTKSKATRSTPATAPGTTNYFSDATSVPAAFMAKIGKPLKILELVIYSDYATTEAEDPHKKGNVDSYLLRGSVGDSEPVQLVADEKTNLNAHLFSVSAVDFGLVPKMVKKAKETAAKRKYEGAQVTHVILERDIPFFNGIVWRVYASSPRDSLYIEFNANGSVRKIYD